MEEGLIQRLDALADRTGRSKGLYLRLALRTVLPTLEEYHWNQVAARLEDSVIERQFREIMEQAPKVQTEQKNGNNTSCFSSIWIHDYMDIWPCL